VARTKSSSLTERCPHALTSSPVGDGDAVVVRLRGEHDRSTVPVLAEILASAVAVDDANLVIDLSEVQFMDAATVRVLLQARDRLAQQSRTFVLRSPSRCAQRVLDLCGASGLIELATVDARRGTRSAAAALVTSVTSPASHDAGSVTLELQESLTFAAPSPQAAVARRVSS
jgi:anti-anti-sigma factor